MIGDILGNRYRILRELGSGGMARVYLAEDINEGQMVAVKVLHPQFGEDVSYLQRFTREAKLAGLLDNPHIVKILDYGSTRGIHYLVMVYVEGRDLHEILSDRGPFQWQDALSIIDQLCEALENAQQYNIVHRDIKPQNILLSQDGQVKVLDFGIARAQMLPSLTQSGFVGSPYYISPEQAMGEDVDIRSDIYSSGIVLYELLSNHVPFDSKSPWSIISKHIVSEFPDIDVENGDIPDAVQGFIQKMVAKKPEDRFQTPTEVRQAIATILAGQSFEETLDKLPTAADVDKAVMADNIYRKAQKAVADEDWQKAGNLLNQALNLDPDHPEAAAQLEEVGKQAQWAALYANAIQALEGKRWHDAIDLLHQLLDEEPEYKDAPRILDQAKSALNKETVELKLTELYDEAMGYFETEDYPNAEKRFAQIQKISPNYRRTSELLTECQRRQASKGAFNRLGQGLKRDNSPAMKWIGLTVLAVILIVVAVLLVSQATTPATPTPSPLDDLFVQAEQAIAQDNPAQATLLLDQILAQNPDYPNAAKLRSQLAAQSSATQQLEQAIAAIEAKDWTTATEILESLRENPPTENSFDPDTVNILLCDAYLARGQDRLEKVTNPKDQATIQSALTDFQAGAQICPSNDALNAQITFANNYLAAQKNGDSPDAIIDMLGPLVKAEPNYAGRQAAQNLYLAYLLRGQNKETAGNIDGALEDYNLALRVNVPDLTEAQDRQAQALQGLTEAPTATPVPPTEVIATEEAATPTPKSGAQPGLKYAAPVLTSPDPLATFSGQFDTIVLSWESGGPLPANEYYDVTIRYFVGEEPRYWGSGLIKENSWQVPPEAGYGQAGKDLFDWWVTIRLGGTAQNGQPDIAISPPSEVRSFIWRP